MARSKRIVILALGSRGDVQPFVALGLGLIRAGYTVRIAAAQDYESLVCEHGLPFAPLVGRIHELMDRELVYAALESGANPAPFARHFLKAVGPLLNRLFADCRAAAEGADALLLSTLARFPGYSVAEALGGLPALEAHFHPVAPSGEFPQMFFPPLFFPSRVYNRLTHRMGEHGLWQLLRRALNVARRDVLGLPPLGPAGLYRQVAGREQRSVLLHAYNPLVAPPPSDWDSRRHVVTGYWPLDRPANWQPPADLVRFLEAGPPPVYVGFGSVLLGRDPDRVTRTLAQALEQSGQRGILFRGWGDVGNVALPPTIHVTHGAYHDWLFSRVGAVVHHGGAGTTAAALRAGVPAVPVPVFGDQRFWARRVFELGVAAAPIPRAALTADRLAAAIRQAVCDDSLRAKARTLAAILASEDGVARAVEVIEAALA